MTTGDSLLRARDQLLAEVADIDTGIGRLVDRRNKLIEAADLLSGLAMQSGAATNGDGGEAPPLPRVFHEPTALRAFAGSSLIDPPKPPSTPAVIAAHMRRAPERWFTSTDLRRETRRKGVQISSAIKAMMGRGEIERGDVDDISGSHGKTRWQYRWVGGADMNKEQTSGVAS